MQGVDGTTTSCHHDLRCGEAGTPEGGEMDEIGDTLQSGIPSMNKYQLNFEVRERNGHEYYVLLAPIEYHSQRYRKIITCPAGMESDGATGAEYIVTRAWWVHDLAKSRKTWDDGTPLSNWQASWLIHDILKEEGRWCRAMRWGFWTWAWGATLGRLDWEF